MIKNTQLIRDALDALEYKDTDDYKQGFVQGLILGVSGANNEQPAEVIDQLRYMFPPKFSRRWVPKRLRKHFEQEKIIDERV